MCTAACLVIFSLCESSSGHTDVWGLPSISAQKRNILVLPILRPLLLTSTSKQNCQNCPANGFPYSESCYFHHPRSQGCHSPLVMQDPMITSLSSSHFPLVVIWFHSLPYQNLLSPAPALHSVHWLPFKLFGHLVFCPVSEIWHVSAHG